MDQVQSTIHLKSPASWPGNKWREALPAGNGIFGAALYGNVRQDTILLNHGALWHGTRRDCLPDVSGTLPEVRALMDDRRYVEANTVLTDALSREGYSSNLGSFLPLGALRLSMPVDRGFENYSRSIEMGTGELAVRWRDGEIDHSRKLFVSRADDIIVCEIEAAGNPMNYTIELEPHRPGAAASHAVENDDILNKNRVSYEEILEQSETVPQGDFIRYASTNSDGTDFGAVFRLVIESGRKTEIDRGFAVTGAIRILLIGRLFVNGDRNREWPKLEKELGDLDSDYAMLMRPHSERHGALFHSTSVRLGSFDTAKSNEELLLEAYRGSCPAELAQRMWAFGRYLLISATREDGLPCALYGLWCGDYNPVFCHNVANVNIEMIYWHALVGGLSGLMHSVFSYYSGLLDDSRENAARLFGCRGINIHGYTSPGIGLATVNVPVIMNWTGAAAWISKFYFDYYIYTGDRQFLAETALPFLQEAALFYEDFLVTGADGMLQFYPSVSPENSPGNFVPEDYDDLGHPLPTTINATMEISVCKELLTNLIHAYRILGKCDSDIRKWEDMLNRMPPYEINSEGAVREWTHPDFEDNDNHRHIAHLYPVFPGQEVTMEGNPGLFRAFTVAAEKRVSTGLSAQSGWSLAYLSNLYARMHNGDEALACLDLLARSCVMSNLLTTHNDWRDMGVCLRFDQAPFQIDANMGWVSAVQEMLLYSSPDLIRILPALPERWGVGEVKGFRFPGGTVSFSWNTRAGRFSGSLSASRDIAFTLELPEFSGNYRWEPDAAIRPTEVLSRYRINLREGEVLRIRSA